MTRKVEIAMVIVCVMVALAACGGLGSSPTPTLPPLAKELLIYGWSEDEMPQLFGEFEREYGVKVNFKFYNSQEQAIDEIRAGQVYDIVDIDNQLIPDMIAGGLLAEIDHRNVPNFKNIAANFRNLIFDPDNRYTVPYTWGTTGLLVRSDLVSEPVTRWADMWDPRYAGRVVGWKATPRYMLAVALLSLGYSVNSEQPAELEAALAKLLELKPRAVWLGGEVDSSAPALISGDAWLAVAWAYDVQLAQAQNDDIIYVLPEEGAIVWGDALVIPATSPNKYTAELFLNYLLRPEVTGRLVNLNYYPMPNDAAAPFIDPELLNDLVIYPDNERIKDAKLLLPLSAEGQRLYDATWARFLAAGD
jgi:spermidine/putrescine transport system substrate-binding protein